MSLLDENATITIHGPDVLPYVGEHTVDELESVGALMAALWSVNKMHIEKLPQAVGLTTVIKIAASGTATASEETFEDLEVICMMDIIKDKIVDLVCFWSVVSVVKMQPLLNMLDLCWG